MSIHPDWWQRTEHHATKYDSVMGEHVHERWMPSLRMRPRRVLGLSPRNPRASLSRSQGQVPELTDALRSMPGVQTVSLAGENGGRLIIETDRTSDLRAEIARMVMQRGLDLLELKLVHLSLEEIFMQLVTEEPVE